MTMPATRTDGVRGHLPIFQVCQSGYLQRQSFMPERKGLQAVPMDGWTKAKHSQHLEGCTFEGGNLLISVPKDVVELKVIDCHIDGHLRIAGHLRELHLLGTTYIGGPLLVDGLGLWFLLNTIEIGPAVQIPRIVVKNWLGRWRFRRKAPPGIPIHYPSQE